MALSNFAYPRPHIVSQQKLFPLDRSTLSLGRWVAQGDLANDTKSAGHCAQMFQQSHEKQCLTDLHFRFLPFSAKSRADWIYPPWLTKHCSWNYQPLVLGDGFASKLSSAMTCFSVMSSQMKETNLTTAVSMDHFTAKLFNPLYPDYHNLPTYEDYVYHRTLLPLKRKVKIVVWQFGSWAIAASNSNAWYRGLDLMASFMARDRLLHNITSFVTAAIPTGGEHHTLERAFKWNWILQRVMKRWGIGFIDTWTPIVSAGVKDACPNGKPKWSQLLRIN